MDSLLQFFHETLGNPWVKRLLVVVVYLFLGKVTDLFVDKGLVRLVAKTSWQADDKMVGFIHRPLVWTVYGLGMLHAMVVPPELPLPWKTVLPAVVKSFLLVVWCVAVLRFLNVIAPEARAKLEKKGTIGDDIFLLTKNLMRVAIVLLAVFWSLSFWEVNLTPLFASAGIAGIAIALAAKDTLANFFGGISIFADKSFRVGDYIILDSGERGEVAEVGIRSTRIKTRDDVIITIPNSILANSKIINESAPVPNFRIRVPVSVSYSSDLDHVEAVLLRVALEHGGVLHEPAPRVRARAFGPSSVDFELLCWVREPALKGLITHHLLKEIFVNFKRESITIPFPQREVHVVTDTLSEY